MLLVLITDEILHALDIGKVSELILLDFSKAFELSNHTLLEGTIHFISVDEAAWRLLITYLREKNKF